jgi:hypothetical protein
MRYDAKVMPVVQTRPFELAVVDGESQRLD